MATANSIRRHGNATHGLSKTPVYRSWLHMRERCNDPGRKDYKSYGGRGIKVCERWQTFENFYADMGDKPSKAHSLDRIDNNGNYEPSNCRWATRTQQQRNTSRTIVVEYMGHLCSLVEWAERIGINYYTLVRRAEAHGLPKALTIPPPPPARRPGVRCGADVHTAVMQEKDIPVIRQRAADGVPTRVLAEEYGVDQDHIRQIIRRKTWKHLP